MAVSALSHGIAGLHRASDRFEASAARIARGGADRGDLATEVVSLLQAKQDFEASTKVIKLADDLQKSLLDILA